MSLFEEMAAQADDLQDFMSYTKYRGIRAAEGLGDLTDPISFITDDTTAGNTAGGTASETAGDTAGSPDETPTNGTYFALLDPLGPYFFYP